MRGIAALWLSLLLILAVSAALAQQIDTTPNPPFPEACGINVALVMDTSNSIARDVPQNEFLMKNAAIAMVNALTGTPSQVGVVSFRTLATLELGLTSIVNQSGADSVNSAIAGIDFTPIDIGPNPGGTNWEGALLAARGLGELDLIVFMTDGNPTTHDGSSDPGYVADFIDLLKGIEAANLAKGDGTRLIAVGIGPSLTVNNLILISGPEENDDYYLANFNALANTLRQIALRLCSSSVTVVKRVQQADGTYAPAPGWTFNASIAGDNPPAIIPNPGITGADGAVNFSWDAEQAHTVTITEQQQAGYVLTGVTCAQGGRSFPFSANISGITLTMQPDDIVACDFYNSNRSASIDIQKTPDTQWLSAGDTAQFSIRVENTGTFNLNNVTVTDALTPDCDRALGLMIPGQVAEYTCSGSAQSSFTNIASVTGTPPVGDPVSDSDDAGVIVMNPGIDIQKTPDTQTILSGEDAIFTIVVTVTGDSTLTNVTVSDALAPDCNRALGTMHAGTNIAYACAAPGVTASFTNVAVVTGTTPLDGSISDSDSAEVLVTAPVSLCDGRDLRADLTGSITPEGLQATGYVTNNGDAECLYHIGLASYEKYNEVIAEQINFAHTNPFVIIAPGQTVSLTVPLPPCATQVDLFYGHFIPDLSVELYGPRLLAARHLGGTNYCTPSDG